jgi:hypothetical protein
MSSFPVEIPTHYFLAPASSQLNDCKAQLAIVKLWRTTPAELGLNACTQIRLSRV